MLFTNCSQIWPCWFSSFLDAQLRWHARTVSLLLIRHVIPLSTLSSKKWPCLGSFGDNFNTSFYTIFYANVDYRYVTPFYSLLLLECPDSQLTANVSVCIFPLEVMPTIFRYGKVAPFYSVSNAMRTVIFGTKNLVGDSFAVLIVWIAISCVTLSLIQVCV